MSLKDIKLGFHLISQLRYKSLENVFNNIIGIDYAVVKGEILSLYAYKKTGERISSDIDILVSRNDLRMLEEAMKQEGFSDCDPTRKDRVLMLTYSHQVSPWTKSMGDRGYIVNVDINFDVFWGEYTGKRIDIKGFLSDTTEMEIYGVKVKTLPPLKAMVQLILHHYKEMNSIYHLSMHNCINYNMFKDVYYLWKNNSSAISLSKLYQMSTEYKIVPYVFYILYFTNQTFHDVELEKYVDAFRTSEGIGLLDYYGLSDKERKPWKVDFKTRLDTENLFELIRDDLTAEDIEKLERNRRIFG